jgi:hypothetical protein
MYGNFNPPLALVFMKIQYSFSSTTWKYEGNAGWYFVSLPNELSQEIRGIFKNEEEGWGRLKATARIGNTEWQTAIWFDTKADTYLLPLKAAIRKKEKIDTGQKVEVTVYL